MLLNIATISKPESISISPVSLVIFFFFNMATLLSGSNDAYVEKKKTYNSYTKDKGIKTYHYRK